MSRAAVVACLCAAATLAAAGEPPTLAGPAMGTTYRVTLARDPPGLARGAVHREIETLLGRLDLALSTWREDSDASRFNRAAAGEWVAVSAELVAVVELARSVHRASRGAFDVTVAPAESGRPVGLGHVESRASPPALRKAVPGVALDLGGIGPGRAVDEIGGLLVALGSTDHLVELGGEVRAWGAHPDGRPWRVRLRPVPTGAASATIELAAGTALATATARPGRSPLDPRTGRAVAGGPATVTVRAASCAVADAWAVAALVRGLPDAIVVDEGGDWRPW